MSSSSPLRCLSFPPSDDGSLFSLRETAHDDQCFFRQCFGEDDQHQPFVGDIQRVESRVSPSASYSIGDGEGFVSMISTLAAFAISFSVPLTATCRVAEHMDFLYIFNNRSILFNETVSLFRFVSNPTFAGGKDGDAMRSDIAANHCVSGFITRSGRCGCFRRLRCRWY